MRAGRRRRLVAPLVLLAASAAVAGGSTAGIDATRQHVAIETKTREAVAGQQHTGAFTLVARDLDSGRTTSVVNGFSSRRRDGQPQEVIRATTTLRGRKGMLVVREIVVGVDAGGGYFALTGTWSVVSGTGSYEGATGGGRVAGVVLPGAQFKAVSLSRYEGFFRVP